MKLLAFTVYDEKADAFGHPFFVSAIGIAGRMMSEWANNQNGMIGKHPEDFKLYHIGHYLDDQAKFDNLDVPKLISAATDYVKKTNNNYQDQRTIDGKEYVSLKEVENG